MSPPAPKAVESLDSQADALASTERRRAVLERLTGMGIALAKEIVERAINSPYPLSRVTNRVELSLPYPAP